MNKKKRISLMLLVFVALTSLFACSSNEATESEMTESEEISTEAENTEATEPTESEEETSESVNENSEEEIRLGVMKGATGIGALEMAENKEETNNFSYELTIGSGPDELVGLLAKKDLDLAIIPSNLASIIYNNGDLKIKALASNNLGVLYLIERGDSVNELKDLEGKEIGASGKGTVPEAVVRNIFAKNDVDDSTLSFYKDPEEVSQMLLGGTIDLAIMPEPIVTNLIAKDDSLRVALDMNEEWNAVSGGSRQITSVLVAREEFLENIDPELIIDDLESSIAFANEKVDQAAELSEKYDLFPKAVAEKAIPKLNLFCLRGEEFKTDMTEYLKVLEENNPESIGGGLPADEFYLQK